MLKKTTKEAKKQSHDHKSHNAPLQDKLKDKSWDPMQEILQITDEYEEGTPKREAGRDYWGACCLESQDVDVVQKPKQAKKK